MPVAWESLVGKDNAWHATRPLGRSASRANRARKRGRMERRGLPEEGARSGYQNSGAKDGIAKAKSLA